MNTGMRIENIDSEIVTEAYELYISTRKQDSPHNFLLEKLVSSNNFSEPPYNSAISALYNSYTNSFNTSWSLFRARNQDIINQLEGSELFIRDYLSFYGSGGRSDTDRVVIGGSNDQNYLIIEDHILEPEFSIGGIRYDNTLMKTFNSYVDKVNEKLQQYNLEIALSDPIPEVRYLRGVAHRDAIQLIPQQKNSAGDVLSHFTGTVARYITIKFVKIKSTGLLQGIFASDGAFRDLNIINNDVNVQGSHSIAISGMLSGIIDGNNTYGKTINLYPLRIGGGHKLKGNIFITSFENDLAINESDINYYKYWDIKDLSGNPAKVNDLRKKKFSTNIGYKFYGNVNVKKVYQEYERTSMVLSSIIRNESLRFNDEQVEKEISDYWSNILDQSGAKLL